jgi:hypothetical protein
LVQLDELLLELEELLELDDELGGHGFALEGELGHGGGLPQGGSQMSPAGGYGGYCGNGG